MPAHRALSARRRTCDMLATWPGRALCRVRSSQLMAPPARAFVDGYHSITTALPLTFIPVTAGAHMDTCMPSLSPPDRVRDPNPDS